MKKEIIRSEAVPAPIGPYSQAVKIGNMLFCSGMIALDTSGNMIGEDAASQAEQVMKNIGNLLGAAGLEFQHVVKASIFLKDMNDFAAVNEVYGRFFTSEPPARETVQVSRLPKDALVEISVTAYIP